jgi:bacterioferritin
MKGQPVIIERLNARLSEELAAINQYMVHSEMCANWNYDRLHEAIEKRAIQEMKHAEKLIARILFLEGKPIVSRLEKINIGADVPAQLQNDLASELEAVKAYNADIKLAAEKGDNGTRELLDAILKDEEEHVDWLEAQRDQVEQLGLANYLTIQASGEEG